MATAVRSSIATQVLILMVAAAIFLNYVDRGAIAVAGPQMKTELGLSATKFGIAVSAFFWVYAPIQLLVGWLCDRLCVYRLFGAGVALWALSTTLTGFVGGLVSLVILRLLLGLGESIAFPGSSKIIVRHVAPGRRGIANAAVVAAMALGPALGTLGGGMIAASLGWRAVFLLFGLATFLWLMPWWTIARPFAADAMASLEPHFPLSRLIARRALWGTSIGHFTANYGFYFVLTWLPLYLVQARGYSIETMALLAAMLSAAQAASTLLFGWASDHWVAQGGSEAVIRKMLIIASHVGSALCIFAVASADSFAALCLWLTLTGLAFGMCGFNLYAVAQMFAGPRAAGSWIGVQNMTGNFAGIVGPIVTGLILDHGGSYMAAFVVAAGFSLVGALWWWLFVPRIEPIALD